MLAIAVFAVFITFAYFRAQGCPFKNALIAVSAVLLMAIVAPDLRGLQPATYALAMLMAWITLQFAMPVADPTSRRWGWRLGRLAVAVVVR